MGPAEIRRQVAGHPRGLVITSRTQLAEWAHSAEAKVDRGWATYVISAEGALLLAPRRTEHVVCAGGQPVRCAGELRVDEIGEILEISNNSTGYCPSEDTWPAVENSLSGAGLGSPGRFTFLAIFRRCEVCGQRNLVKDDWFECAVCKADLPAVWNFTASFSAR